MESAEDRAHNNSALPAPNRQRGSVQAEAAMGAIVVVVVDEFGQDRAQVALANGYQVVEALGADGPHPALRNRVARGA
jgi:hypothetical protein